MPAMEHPFPNISDPLDDKNSIPSLTAIYAIIVDYT